MGVTSIPEERIREGVNRLERVIRDLSGDHLERLAPDDPALLDELGLRRLLPGATIHYKTFYCDPCTIELHPDGRMSGRAGHANEDCDEGRWWVEDDLYCRQWNQWGYGETSRLQVTLHGNLIRWWRPGGRLVDAAIIETAP
jgi:GntR family transcriptional regulator/MocR family aminotransferase